MAHDFNRAILPFRNRETTQTNPEPTRSDDARARQLADPLFADDSEKLDPNAMTVEDCLERIVLADNNDRAKGTVRDLRRYVRNWNQFWEERAERVSPNTRTINPRVRVVPLADCVLPCHLRWFQDWMSSNGFSATKSRKHSAAIEHILRSAGNASLLTRTPPKIAKPDLPPPAKLYLSEDQLSRAFAAATVVDWPTVEPIRQWQSRIVLASTYGFRVQELIRGERTEGDPLTWANVYPAGKTPAPFGHAVCDRGWLHLRQHKTGKQFYFPLTVHAAAVMRFLRSIRADECDEVFDWSVNGRAKGRQWRAILESAGIERSLYDPGQSRIVPLVPKILRATCATRSNDQFLGLGELLLGHASCATTDKYYSSTENRLVDNLERLRMPSAFDSVLDW